MYTNIIIILLFLLLINNKIKKYNKYILIFLIIILIKNINNISELFTNDDLLDAKNRKFPYRYFKDENNNTLSIVAITGFFRSDEDKELYYIGIFTNGIITKGIKINQTSYY